MFYLKFPQIVLVHSFLASANIKLGDLKYKTAYQWSILDLIILHMSFVLPVAMATVLIIANNAYPLSFSMVMQRNIGVGWVQFLYRECIQNEPHDSTDIFIAHPKLSKMPLDWSYILKAQSHLDVWRERVNTVWENHQHVQKLTCAPVNHPPTSSKRVYNVSKTTVHRVVTVLATFPKRFHTVCKLVPACQTSI